MAALPRRKGRPELVLPLPLRCLALERIVSGASQPFWQTPRAPRGKISEIL